MQAGPHGGEWAASALPPLHGLLAAHRLQVTSALAAAYGEAVFLLPDEVICGLFCNADITR